MASLDGDSLTLADGTSFSMEALCSCIQGYASYGREDLQFLLKQNKQDALNRKMPAEIRKAAYELYNFIKKVMSANPSEPLCIKPEERVLLICLFGALHLRVDTHSCLAAGEAEGSMSEGEYIVFANLLKNIHTIQDHMKKTYVKGLEENCAVAIALNGL